MIVVTLPSVELAGRDHAAAYLKTVLRVDKDTPARFEIGSDDGVRVWVNGVAVHSNNAVRPHTAGQDKVSVSLKAGENKVLMKISRGSANWSASLRVRNADGSPIAGLAFGQ